MPQHENKDILTLSESPAIHTVDQNFINMECFEIEWISSPAGNASKVFQPTFISLYPLKNDHATLSHVINLAATGSNEILTQKMTNEANGRKTETWK